MHYAKITRAEEERLYGPGSDFKATPGPASRFLKQRILRKEVEQRPDVKPRLSVEGEAQIPRPADNSSNEKLPHERKFEPMVITDEEWINASRAARTASW
jgi:hypothetical protein